MSPGAISWPPTVTVSSIAPTISFVAPRMRTKRVQIGSPISTSSSTSRTPPSISTAAAPCTLNCVASRSPIIAERRRLGHGHDDHVAGLDRGDRGVHHQVVALAAADGACRARDP